MAISTKNTGLKSVYGKVRDRYLELIERFPLRPIRNDRELDSAIEVMNQLIDEDKLSPPEADYLDVLSDLVESYEEQTVKIAPASDARMLRYLLDLKDLKQVEVSNATGIAVTTISQVLSGKRKLTRQQIGELSRFFAVNPSTFDLLNSH